MVVLTMAIILVAHTCVYQARWRRVGGWGQRLFHDSYILHLCCLGYARRPLQLMQAQAQVKSLQQENERLKADLEVRLIA